MSFCLILLCRVASGGSASSGVAVVAIGGAVGGVVMFLLLIVLCVVVLFVRWSHKKQAYSIDKDRVDDEPSTSAVIVPNAVYMTMKPDSRDYDYIKDDEIVLPYVHDGVKMESNPSYGITGSSTNKQDSDVIIHPNPSYGVTKATRKTSEDQYGYVQPNEFVHEPPVHHATKDDTVMMEDNPSYGLAGRENKAVSQGSDSEVKIIPNPAYHSVTNADQNRKTSDYDYVHTDSITIT